MGRKEEELIVSLEQYDLGQAVLVNVWNNW